MGVVGSLVMLREARLCIRQLRLLAREREGAVATVTAIVIDSASPPSEASTHSWMEDMELVGRCSLPAPFARAIETLVVSRAAWTRESLSLDSSSWVSPPKPAAIIRTLSLSPSRATPPRDVFVRGS